MSYYTDSQIFYINSRNKLSGSHTSFSYALQIDPHKHFDRVAVLDISIPKSFYIIPTGANTFTLTEDGTPVIITLTAGNYNRRSLALEIQSQLNTNSPNGYTYTITYQNISNTGDSGKYTFTCSNTVVDISFTFTTNLYEQMGFEKNTTHTFTSGILVCTNVINLNFETTLFLQSNICNNINDNILQNVITSGSSDYSMITWHNPDVHTYSKEFIGNGQNVFNFGLYNENDELMDTNGINIVFTIILYKTNNIDDMIKKYIKLRTLQIK